jgi:hypothetical protein
VAIRAPVERGSGKPGLQVVEPVQDPAVLAQELEREPELEAEDRRQQGAAAERDREAAAHLPDPAHRAGAGITRRRDCHQHGDRQERSVARQRPPGRLRRVQLPEAVAVRRPSTHEGDGDRQREREQQHGRQRRARRGRRLREEQSRGAQLRHRQEDRGHAGQACRHSERSCRRSCPRSIEQLRGAGHGEQGGQRQAGDKEDHSASFGRGKTTSGDATSAERHSHRGNP